MKKSIHILFSSNDKIGSKIIAYGTKYLAKNTEESVSHVAILVNNRWVHESTGNSGVIVQSYNKWSKTHKEKARIFYGYMEYQDLAEHYRKIKFCSYDYFGVIYLTIYIFLNLLLNIDLPKKNKWESENKYFCCEVVGKLTNKYYGMKAPVQILEELRTKEITF